MKILYGIQATGNGHVTRSIEVIRELRQKVEVDILLSGNQADIEVPFEVKYRFKGVSFIFGKNGGVSIFKTIKNLSFIQFFKDLIKLDLSEYDMVISDFEPLTSWKSWLSNTYSVGLSNQCATLLKGVPRPKGKSGDIFGKWVLKYYAPSQFKYGIHYKRYNANIFKPVIRQEIRELKPYSGDYNLVYLPSYNDRRLLEFLRQFTNEKWVVFSKHNKAVIKEQNIEILPISQEKFLQKLEGCKGIICNAGFGTTTEALFLRKKMCVIPMKRQYEQECNAYCLAQIGVPIIPELESKHFGEVREWLQKGLLVDTFYTDNVRKIVNVILEDFIRYRYAFSEESEMEKGLGY